MDKIVLIEDDPGIRTVIRLALKGAGFASVCEADNGADGLALVLWEKPALVILDLMLPGMDGLAVCSTIRRTPSVSGTPIVMLTARSTEEDVVRGLELGADDYITKPFSLSELTARVDAIYRRVCMSFSHDESSPVIESGPFTLNLKSRTVSKNGTPIDLTQVEYQILEYFLNNKNTALDRESILKHIWGENYYGDYKIVDVNIRRIRLKIEDEPSNPQYIVTIWGYGYKWNDKG